MPDELREEVAIELEAMAQVVDELLALQRDVAKREPKVFLTAVSWPTAAF